MEIKCKCGSSDYYITQRGIHQTAYCKKCDSYIKNLPQGKPFVFMFGKFKGTALVDMISTEQLNYLHWILSSDMNNTIKTKVVEHLKTINHGQTGA